MEQITLPANVDSLADVFGFIDNALKKSLPDKKQQYNVKTAVEEIFVNIARYAYPSGEGDVTVSVSLPPDKLAIEFKDGGTQYNPLDKPDPDTSLSADEREIGGLGIYMVKNIMDEVSYEYRDGQNVLTIAKKTPARKLRGKYFMKSLRAKILAIVILFPALIGTAFVMYSVIATGNYKRMRLENIEMTVAYSIEKINKIIADIERGAILYALGGIICHEESSRELGEKIAVEYISSFSLTVGGGFWFEPYAYKEDQLRAGFYAFYDKTVGRVRLDDTFFMDEYDYHNMSWYTEIIGSVTQPYQVAWTKPYVDDSGSYSLMTTAGSSIFGEDGRPIAISTIDWEIEKMIETLSQEIQPTKGSFVLLCVPEKDYVIINTLNGNSGTSVKEIPWDLNTGSFEMNGVRYIVISRVLDNGWYMSVQIPAHEIFAEMESENRNFSLIIFFSTVLMLCGAFYLISKLLNRPLKRLTDGVSRLGLGNLDTRIDVASDDELGLLAQTFNKMTADLETSIENYTRERSEKERIGAELSIATKIQASMLPRIFPPFPDRNEFDICASMLPAKEVGGDFYDFFMVDGDKLAVVIADVSCKGVPAALFMVIAKTLIKNNAQKGKTLKEVFETVNNLLCENNDAGMFVTAFMGILDIPTGKFSFVNAGHNAPLIKRADGEYVFLKIKPALILAGFEGTAYREEETDLLPGDVIYLYTDGVTEAMNTENELFSDPRLLETANRYKDCDVKELLESIKKEVDLFANGAEQADDVTMLALRYKGLEVKCND